MMNFRCDRGCCKYHVMNWVKPKGPFIRNMIIDGKRPIRRKAGVFAYDPLENKVLLVQSCGKLWGPPKGSVEENETFSECAKRELCEETGLVVSDEIYQNPVTLKPNTVYFYAQLGENNCQVQSSNGNDANGVGWFQVDCLVENIKSGKIKVNQHLKLTFKHFLNIHLFENKE